MNLVQFNSMLSASLKRGTTLDNQIPQQVAMAVQWIERNYTFRYMEQFRLITIKEGQRVIDMPSCVIKGWLFFRVINPDGTYSYVKKVEAADLTQVSSTANTFIVNASPAPVAAVFKPMHFFQIGVSKVVLDAVPSQDFSAEAMFHGFSDWPVDTSTIPGGTSTFTSPLIDMASDVLLAQAQMFCAVNLLKDLRMMEGYKLTRDEGLNTLTRMEDEQKFSSQDMVMLYKPPFSEQQISSANNLGF